MGIINDRQSQKVFNFNNNEVLLVSRQKQNKIKQMTFNGTKIKICLKLLHNTKCEKTLNPLSFTHRAFGR